MKKLMLAFGVVHALIALLFSGGALFLIAIGASKQQRDQGVHHSEGQHQFFHFKYPCGRCMDCRALFPRVTLGT